MKASKSSKPQFAAIPIHPQIGTPNIHTMQEQLSLNLNLPKTEQNTLQLTSKNDLTQTIPGTQVQQEQTTIGLQTQLHQIHCDQPTILESEMLATPLPLSIVESQKRSMEQAFIQDAADNKKRKINEEQQLKRHRYDVLKAFFRIYFRVDANSMVMKDAISNLYTRKIAEHARIARNAMYRHMWSFFKDKITAFQRDYREYITGIKLVITQDNLDYEGYEKDLDTLQAVGVSELFDFVEEELSKPSPPPAAVAVAVSPSIISPVVLSPANIPAFGVAQQYLTTENEVDDESGYIDYIEQLEITAKNLVNALNELKGKMRAKKKIIKSKC